MPSVNSPRSAQIAVNWLRAITAGNPLRPNRSWIGACSSNGRTFRRSALARCASPRKRPARRRQMPQSRQCLLEVTHRFPVDRAGESLEARLMEIRDCGLPKLAAHGMMGKLLDVFRESIRIEAFDGADDAGVEIRASLLEQGAVGHFMG